MNISRFVHPFMKHNLLYKTIRKYADVSYDIPAYKTYLLETKPPSSTTVTEQEAKEILTKMVTIRRFENTAANLYKAKKIRGFCHLYAGQEAVAVGIHSAMRPPDTLITAYRCHGYTYLMGETVEAVFAELIARKTGVSKGKGGSMHMYARNFYGGNGIVGAHVPLGTGLALASQYKKDGGVCFAIYGDGASRQGQLYEAFNMAQLWKLPVVYVVENNHYAMGTSTKRGSAQEEYYKQCEYIPGIWVDGMDVICMKEATKFCIDHCTSGKGPIIMEANTYRYYGHSMSDPGTSYRSRDEVTEVRQTMDPITMFRKKISSFFSEDDYKALDKEIKKQDEEALKKAEAAPIPVAQDLYTDIYAVWDDELRNIHVDKPLKHIRVSTPVNLK